MRLPATVFSILLACVFCVDVLHSLTWNPMKLHSGPPNQILRSSRRLPLQFLDQRVDNFNPQNVATFQQAYFENDEFFAQNGPLFIFVGGEWEITGSNMILGGHIFNLAEEFNATLFYTEHRFYGESFPTEDLSIDNLRLLSVEQALADLANFIVQIKRKNKRYANSKVILIGGSYSASMVSWFRQKYPHLTVGAWASGGPFLAQVDFYEYKEIMGASIRNVGGKACYARIENAFSAADQLLAENRLDEFRQHFAACANFGSHPMDAYMITMEISDFLAEVVQFHTPGDIERMCEDIMRNETTSSDDLSEFGRFIRDIVVRSDANNCMESYSVTVESFRNETRGAPRTHGSRSFLYQTCTEFGWFQTSTSAYQPFGSSFPLELFYNLCTDVYGDHINRNTIQAAIDRTNVVFGGLNPKVRNVYFTNGWVDPWRAMSIQEDLNEWSPADIIPDVAHWSDFGSESERDSVEMLQVKNRVRTLFQMWLAL